MGLFGMRALLGPVGDRRSWCAGKPHPVAGTWRSGYIEFSFDAELGNPANPVIAPAILAGWIDGGVGSGRMKVVDRTDGRWTAVRKP